MSTGRGVVEDNEGFLLLPGCRLLSTCRLRLSFSLTPGRIRNLATTRTEVEAEGSNEFSKREPRFEELGDSAGVDDNGGDNDSDCVETAGEGGRDV